jgi:hypothetical protein
MVQWMNTAFIIWIIKPKSEMLNESYIAQISNILWADSLTQPLLLLLDIPGNVVYREQTYALVSHYITLTWVTELLTPSFGVAHCTLQPASNVKNNVKMPH